MVPLAIRASSWPISAEMTRLVPSVNATASANEPATISLVATRLKRSRLISGRIRRCWTAGALTSTRLVSAQKKVPRNINRSFSRNARAAVKRQDDQERGEHLWARQQNAQFAKHVGHIVVGSCAYGNVAGQ